MSRGMGVGRGGAWEVLVVESVPIGCCRRGGPPGSRRGAEGASPRDGKREGWVVRLEEFEEGAAGHAEGTWVLRDRGAISSCTLAACWECWRRSWGRVCCGCCAVSTWLGSISCRKSGSLIAGL